MRSFLLVGLAAVNAFALSIPHQPPPTTFEVGNGGVLNLPKARTNLPTGRGLKRRGYKARNKRKCAPKPTQTMSSDEPTPTSTEDQPGSTSTESEEPTATVTEPPSEPTESETPTPTSPTSTEPDTPEDGPTKTQSGPTPSATKATDDDPWLTSLSIPLNYNAIPDFSSKKTGGVMTYYAQSQGACGDTYDDSTYTAAISKLVYDAWPGASDAQNRNPVCGPFVSGRYFLTPADEKVPGKMHANIGGDGFINCWVGEQCHVPLTATVRNPQTNVSLTVAVVDRCDGCQSNDIDLTPAAFLKLTRPDLDTSGFGVSEYMAEASKDQQGRVPVEWSFDQTQLFKGVVGEMGGKGCAGGCISAF